jgi:hypothetical protein
MIQRYISLSLGGGWYAVFDKRTGLEVKDAEAYSGCVSMGSRIEAKRLAEKLNSAA